MHAPQFDDDRDQVIDRARAAGVGLMINICDRVSNFDAVYAIADANPDIWATVGTHPHEARENPDLTAASLLELAQNEGRRDWGVRSRLSL
ncbi:urease/pyrimidinase family protein [Asticcacaulis biprosthecium C19]|uniref:Urease/pyrimidinase family protein n=1 Tax=Asticcacaulis biprosthecium C19 TaxID=715226 RepID=F4QQT4_9CAUL|nr:urease/pyrimidinase family protein [Asticcacaulis biprosthecium C19]